MSLPVKILLADASTTMQRAVKLALKKEPYELLCADNGTDALRICKEQKCALVIADLELTGLSAPELIQKIQEDPHLKKTQTVLICASFQQIDEASLKDISADARLWKPFESHVLVSLLRTLLKDHPQMQKTAKLAKRGVEYTKPMLQKSPQSSLKEKTVKGQEAANSFTQEIPADQIRNNLWKTPFEAAPKDSSEALRTLEKTQKISSSDDSQTDKNYDVIDRAKMPSQKSVEEMVQAQFDSLSIYDEIKPQLESQIKTLVRAEIHTALNSWFKEQLEEKLKNIIKMIETEEQP